jgi:uncharacterized membrane protein
MLSYNTEMSMMTKARSLSSKFTENKTHGLKNNHPAMYRPFIIDLEATNGTSINGERIPASRYVELKMKDVVTFGQSTREYVLLHSD